MSGEVSNMLVAALGSYGDVLPDGRDRQQAQTKRAQGHPFYPCAF